MKSLVFIFINFLFQFSFLPTLGWQIAIPNLVLISAVVVGFGKSFQSSFGWILLAGFLFEIFSFSFWNLNLITFIVVGVLAWFIKNIFLDERKSFLLDVLFWFLIKIIWDLFLKLNFILTNLFDKSFQPTIIFNFSGDYFLEIMIFIVSGLVFSLFWSLIEKPSIKKS